MLEFSKKSWHYKLYEFSYGERREWHSWTGELINNYPKNLCPYFWKIVLAVLLLPILLIIGWPMLILDKERVDEEGFVSFIPLVGIFIHIALFLIFCVLAMPFTFGVTDPFWKTVNVIGICIVSVGVIVAIGYFIGFLVEKWRSRPTVEREPSLLSQFIKAKKEKICPQIKWK